MSSWLVVDLLLSPGVASYVDMGAQVMLRALEFSPTRLCDA
jgi:hypothetical protein